MVDDTPVRMTRHEQVYTTKAHTPTLQNCASRKNMIPNHNHNIIINNNSSNNNNNNKQILEAPHKVSVLLLEEISY